MQIPDLEVIKVFAYNVYQGVGLPRKMWLDIVLKNNISATIVGTATFNRGITLISAMPICAPPSSTIESTTGSATGYWIFRTAWAFITGDRSVTKELLSETQPMDLKIYGCYYGGGYQGGLADCSNPTCINYDASKLLAIGTVPIPMNVQTLPTISDVMISLQNPPCTGITLTVSSTFPTVGDIVILIAQTTPALAGYRVSFAYNMQLLGEVTTDSTGKAVYSWSTTGLAPSTTFNYYHMSARVDTDCVSAIKDVWLDCMRGNLIIESIPAGAQVWQPRFTNASGTTPWNASACTGTNTYILKMIGYADETITIDTIAGQLTTRSITLTPGTSSLIGVVNKFDVDVYVRNYATNELIDSANVTIGISSGRTDAVGYVKITVDSGIQNITIKKDGFYDISDTITILGPMWAQFMMNPSQWDFDIYISDVETKELLKDANIKFEGPRNVRQGITDANGYLKLTLDDGINIITVTKTGYITYTDIVTINTPGRFYIVLLKTRYSCMNNVCKEDPSGAYTTPEECLAKSTCKTVQQPGVGVGGLSILIGLGLLGMALKAKK